MKFKIPIFLGVLIIFLLTGHSVINNALAQANILTDSDALFYYTNPSDYLYKQVNFTGKILNLLPPSSGILGLQIYQAGDTNRNTIVVYDIPLQLSRGDCIRVIGLSQPVTEYQNMFGVKLSAAAIDADSIERIDCSESIEPAKKVVNVNQVQEKNNIKITFNKLEFSDANTRAYITVENTRTSGDITFNEVSTCFT